MHKLRMFFGGTKVVPDGGTKFPKWRGPLLQNRTSIEPQINVDRTTNHNVNQTSTHNVDRTPNKRRSNFKS